MADVTPHGDVEIVRAGPVALEIDAPASKSATNRALVVAALADGESTLMSPLTSDDTDAMRCALEQLGVEVAIGDDTWVVKGHGGRLRSPRDPIDARLSGTTMRFICAVAALAPGRSTVTGDRPLLRRPIGPLVQALTTLGAGAQASDGLPPVHLRGGGIAGGEVTLDAAKSSQFVTAVLLVAPYASNDVSITATHLVTRGYVDITVDVMRRNGVVIDATGHSRWRIPGGQRYRASVMPIEYDASAAAHLFALAVATGGRVTVTNACSTLQPDAGIVAVFESMGAVVSRGESELTVAGPPALRPVDVDLGGMPDQLATVATLAALAPGTSSIRNVAITRGHETDRLAAVARELSKVGADVDELPDGLVVRGGSHLRPAQMRTYDDHRLAMAFAALGARLPGTVIEDAGCVAKTYPRFWADCEAAGLEVRVGG